MNGWRILSTSVVVLMVATACGSSDAPAGSGDASDQTGPRMAGESATEGVPSTAADLESSATPILAVGDSAAEAPDSGAALAGADPAKRVAFAWSEDVDELHEQVFAELLRRDPEYATDLGLADELGVPEDILTDVSEEYELATDAIVADTVGRLESLDTALMTPDQRMAHDALCWELRDRMAAAEFRDNVYPVNQVFGVQSSLPEFLAFVHPLESEADARDYIARLEAIGPRFEQVGDGLEARALRGSVAPRFVLGYVLAGMRDFVATPASDNVLAYGFRSRIADVPSLGAGMQAELASEVEDTIERAVYPAYQGLIATVEELERQADDDAGAWKLPDGEAYYAYVLRHHTTTDLTADQIHELGLAEVARIQEEMRSLLVAAGYDSDLNRGIGQLHADADAIVVRSDADRDAAIAAYRQALDRAEEATGHLFELKPDAELEIARVPPFKEFGGPGAYYSPPPVTGDRPGVFLVNLPEGRTVSMVGVPTLAVHEGVPGHHYQLSVQRSLEGAPVFMRALHNTGYSEGWALYAERLVAEQGMYDGDLAGDVGRLQAELFRAARLVVDTGLHDRQWSRQQAIDYMSNTLNWPEGSAASEVDRYIVMPGQATAYKVGQLTLLRLRDEAEAALGDRFDLREFHTVILEHGQLPLEVLERVVDDWVAEELASL